MATTNSAWIGRRAYPDTAPGATGAGGARVSQPAPPRALAQAAADDRRAPAAGSRCARGRPVARQRAGRKDSGSITQSRYWCLNLVGLLTAGWVCYSDDNSNFAKRAEQNYQDARKKFQNNTNDAEAAWQFGRACFDWADFAKNDAQREAIAKRGIAACRQVIARDPKSAPGHYFLGMD